MQIKNGRLTGARFVKANASGGDLKPSLIICHDTAGRLDKGNTVNYFASKQCTVSAHVVVERDGTIVQMVPFNKRAWHAGQSEWKGKKLCNSFSIGIEIVNPGKLDANGRAWFHKKTEEGFKGIQQAKTKAHGDGWWLPYAPEQIKAVKELCRALVAEYPDVNDIATHWQVSPGRKVDTCPLFPLEDVEAFAFGTVEPEVLDVPPVAAKPEEVTTKELAKVSRKAKWLVNVRRFFDSITVTSILGGLGIATDTSSKVKQIISVEALAGLVTVGLLVSLLIAYLIALMREDVAEGRYVPSGAVDAESAS